MSDPHLSVEDLNAFAQRRLDPSRVQAVFAHLSACPMCRTRSQEAFETDRSVDRLLADVGPPRTTLSRRVLALAAALAIAVIGGLLFVLRSGTVAQEPPTMTMTAVVQNPATQAPPPAVTPPDVPRVDPVIAEALERGALAPPQLLASLLATPAWERTRGSSAYESATYEPNREVVASQRPRFRFPAERGAPGVVRVFDRDREVLHSEPIESGEWTATADLPRGVLYTWQVETTRNGETVTAPAPPAPPARFIVLDDDAHRALEAARREQPQNDLLLGILAARAGLRDEAAKHLQSAANAGDPRVRTLLRSVQNWPR